MQSAGADTPLCVVLERVFLTEVPLSMMLPRTSGDATVYIVDFMLPSDTAHSQCSWYLAAVIPAH